MRRKVQAAVLGLSIMALGSLIGLAAPLVLLVIAVCVNRWVLRKTGPDDFDPVLMSAGFVGLLLGLVLVITSLSWGITSWINSSRVPDGHCRRCDYDLRGCPTNPRCPECGTPAD